MRVQADFDTTIKCVLRKQKADNKRQFAKVLIQYTLFEMLISSSKPTQKDPST